MATLDRLRRRIVLGNFIAWVMSYARPLFWMALRLVKTLVLHMLSLLLGFVIAAIGLAAIWLVQDLTGWGV